MKKVIFKTKTADFKQGKFIDENIVAVVASTKSQNNLSDEIKKSGKIITEEIECDLFLDKIELMKVVDSMDINKMLDVSNSIVTELNEKEIALVKSHIKEVLKGGCLFKVEKK